MLIKDFMEFLKQYQVIGLAIAVVIGSKANELVKTTVDHLVMPFIGLLVPGGDWRTLTINLGEAKFGVGFFMGSVLDFTIVAWVVFMFCKFVMKEEKVTKK